MRLVIVTGLSGSGKNTALKFFEDHGYYCVDNLPPLLIPTFADLVTRQTSEIHKVALGIDARSGDLDAMGSVFTDLDARNIHYEILFLEASDETLIKRYKETRRNHPMDEHKSIVHGIGKERQELAFLKQNADYIIDTSSLLVRELGMELKGIFEQNKEYKNLFVTILSFGFKHGIPADCDLVWDVRFLPNPYYVPELRNKTGEDEEVRRFVLDSDVSREFISRMIDMTRFLLPQYVREGRNQLVIGIGCTGGHHRSVTVARALYEALKSDDECGWKLSHRDIKR